MKAKLQNKTKFLALSLVAVLSNGTFTRALASEPHESGAGKVCGVLRSFEGETQIFDYTRTHLGDASFGTKLHCGDWVSVDKGKATIELSVGAGVLAGENTFFQILDPQSGENPDQAHLALYRGEFLAQPAKIEIRIVTPNAIGRVAKGGAYVVYASAAEETQIVGLGGETTLENRFFPEPRMTAGFGKVVTFANPVERLLPDQARFVNARDLNERLARLGVPVAVRDMLEKAVKVGSKTKMPVTLATTAKAAPKGMIHVAPGGEFAGSNASGNRSPASVSAPVVAAKKPKFAARKRVVSDEPNFALKRASSDESEKKRLLQALSSMRPDDDSQ
jgi:hypothetical protein